MTAFMSDICGYDSGNSRRKPCLSVLWLLRRRTGDLHCTGPNSGAIVVVLVVEIAEPEAGVELEQLVPVTLLASNQTKNHLWSHSGRFSLRRCLSLASP